MATEPPELDLRVIENKNEKISTLEKENKILADQLYNQKQISTKLQKALLARYQETDSCLQTNERLVAELVQSKAKLANRGSKLEAVTLIAEATAVIGALDNQPKNRRQEILAKKAKQYLLESKAEVEKENFEGASYLCRKAMEQVKGIEREKNKGNISQNNEEVSFSTPLQMELLKNGNLRNKPSTQAEIIAVLQTGRSVSAIGFNNNWVKVQVGEPVQTGWMHISLLY
ncbi:SH3 domain-containing protein [Desulfopila sp. IMCC35008]|uniref:SH3 domain-containing protein n=1 Tax=Desulfopila sp. IMCC35008 TaxID=2653858 RepID=UPI0013D2D1EB|nr:SH3 domain-containing protein [Desulfopila sp. IMCC35008]